MCKVPNKYVVFALLAILTGAGSAIERAPGGYSRFTGLDAVIVGWSCGAFFFANIAVCSLVLDRVGTRMLHRRLPFMLGWTLMLAICGSFITANLLALPAIRSWYGNITYLETGKVEARHAR
jgi:predicted transporter